MLAVALPPDVLGLSALASPVYPPDPPTLWTLLKVNHILVNMSTLQEQLARAIQKRGENSPVAQILRNQIQAQKSGKTFQELYLTGSVKKQPSLRAQDHVLDLLKHYNLPLTRDNYLELAYPDGVPEDLDESSLPSEIRLE